MKALFNPPPCVAVPIEGKHEVSLADFSILVQKGKESKINIVPSHFETIAFLGSLQGSY